MAVTPVEGARAGDRPPAPSGWLQQPQVQDRTRPPCSPRGQPTWLAEQPRARCRARRPTASRLRALTSPLPLPAWVASPGTRPGDQVWTRVGSPEQLWVQVQARPAYSPGAPELLERTRALWPTRAGPSGRLRMAQTRPGQQARLFEPAELKWWNGQGTPGRWTASEGSPLVPDAEAGLAPMTASAAAARSFHSAQPVASPQVRLRARGWKWAPPAVADAPRREPPSPNARASRPHGPEACSGEAVMSTRRPEAVRPGRPEPACPWRGAPPPLPAGAAARRWPFPFAATGRPPPPGGRPPRPAW